MITGVVKRRHANPLKRQTCSTVSIILMGIREKCERIRSLVYGHRQPLLVLVGPMSRTLLSALAQVIN